MYKITRKTTGEYYYGIHRGDHFDGYWGSGRVITDYIKAHGTSDLLYEVLVIGEYNYIIDVESRVVTLCEIAKPLCWNLKAGGYRGLPGPETRAKIIASNTGRTYSPGRNTKIQASRKLKIDVIGDKISKSNTGKVRTEQQKSNISAGKIAAMNQDTKDKISASKTGSKNPSWLGYVVTPEGVFESTIAAAKHFGVTDACVGRRCKSSNPKFSGWYQTKEITCQ